MVSEWAESGTTLNLIFIKRALPGLGVRYIIMGFSLTRAVRAILLMEIAHATHALGAMNALTAAVWSLNVY